MLRVTPVYGSTGQNPDSNCISTPPSSTLIEYGGVRILVNVGFDESTLLRSSNPNDTTGAEGVPSKLPDVDAVLLTDSSLGALGGIPILYGKNSSIQKKLKQKSEKDEPDTTTQPPIYATFPTVKMGQMNLYDQHANICLDGGDPGYSLSDVDSLFCPFVYQQHIDDGDNNQGTESKLDSSQPKPIQTIKYAQTIVINDPVTNKPAIAVTPQRAGHLIGASYFTLKRLTDETEVVVAPIYHHAKEKHLDNSTLYEYATACDVLVTTCGGPSAKLGSLYIPPKPNMKPILNPPSVTRDESELIESILSTLRRGGNVLLPTDASGRVFELLYLLNNHWERQRLGSAYNLCWVGSMVHNTLEFARSQLEWMNSQLGAQFDSGRGHPFALKSVQMFSTVAELEANCLFDDDEGVGDRVSNPTCVLASGATLDNGPARDLFLKWSENADNAIIITDSRRCVQRGVVVEQRSKQREISGQKSLETGSSELRKVNVVGGTSSEDVYGIGVQVGVSSGEETPNIVQEDEEGSNTINIGTIMSTNRISEYSTSAQLLLKWCEAKAAKEEMADVVECDVMVPKRSPLAGSELKLFLKEEEKKRLKEKAAEERRAMLREVELAKGRLRLSEEDPSTTTKATSKTSKMSSEESSRPKKKGRFDADLFLKFSKPCHMTFEVREEAVGIGQPDSVAKYGIEESIGRAGEVLEDDYGIAVKADRFVDIVTGVDTSKFSKGTGRIGEDVRRLGFGVDGTGKAGNEMEGDEIDIVDSELVLEAQDLSEGTGIIRGRKGRPPVKVTTEPRRLEVLAEIAYVPLEARVDTRNARQAIRALQPRQVVILGSGQLSQNQDESSTMDSPSILKYVVGSRGSVFAPSNNQSVELSVGHAAYAVRLVDQPFFTREEREKIIASGEEIRNAELFESKVGGCTVSLLDYVATGQKVAVDGSIVLAPKGISKGKRPNVMVSDGEVLLTDLRSEIIASRMKAEYSVHVGYSQLIVNGRIVVRKDQETGKIDIEGPLCEDFFNVRQIVCGQYVQI